MHITEKLEYANDNDRNLAIRLFMVYRAVCVMKEQIFNGSFKMNSVEKRRLQYAERLLEFAHDPIHSPTFEGCKYGPESIGIDRAFGAVGDAKACVHSALNGEFYQNDIIQASCELWAAIMNLHNGLDLLSDPDSEQELLDYLDLLRCGK